MLLKIVNSERNLGAIRRGMGRCAHVGLGLCEFKTLGLSFHGDGDNLNAKNESHQSVRSGGLV